MKVGEEGSTKLSFDLHTCTSTYMSPARTYAIIINFKHILPSSVDILVTCLIVQGEGSGGIKKGKIEPLLLDSDQD